MFDSNITVVRTSSARRRAYDDGGDDFVLPSVSRRTAGLSSHVMEDADAIRHASRRQDAHLLNDITARLESAPYSHPMEHHHYHRTQRTLRASSLPPPSARSFHHEDLDFPEYRPHVHRPASSRVFVRAASEPRDIHSTPRVFPGPAYARHRYAYHRASSVPRFTSYHHEPSHSRFSAYHEPSHVRYSMYHAPSIEHHVFHRPTYTPYHWYSGAASLGDLYSAPSFRHRMRDDFHRSWYQPTFKHEFGLDDYYGLEDELPTGRRTYPTRTVVTASHHSHSPSAALARRPPLPTSSARVHPRAAKYLHDTVSDYRDPIPYVPAASITNLRTRAAECRSKMDHQKVLLDRYLPVHMGPDNEVKYEVEAKYGELAARDFVRSLKMPLLEAQRRSRDTRIRASSVPPYRPAARAASASSSSSSSYSRPTRGFSCRPPVSDVRRRAREVLCKTKNDPTYYNY